ncbi:MAG: hypothetical protein IPK01_08500 [Acidobacteria bacterium]|nr:hypothetical protein [Acidobacteriota bacterium]
MRRCTVTPIFLPGTKKAVPTWAGAKHFNRVVLMGTPSEGSAISLWALISGSSIGGLNINLPFVRISRDYDVFTIPSSYQLLPAPGTFQAVDENLEPLNIDLYDPKVWTKYGWNAIDDKGVPTQFNGPNGGVQLHFYRHAKTGETFARSPIGGHCEWSTKIRDPRCGLHADARHGFGIP